MIWQEITVYVILAACVCFAVLKLRRKSRRNCCDGCAGDGKCTQGCNCRAK